MRPGIKGEAPYHGTPTPILCPGCGDRLFSMKPGYLECELCGAEIRVGLKATQALQEGWGGPDTVVTLARPERVTRTTHRQHRKTGALAL